MILLTRLNGRRLLVNSDLIERVDETPDTVITLVDGTRYLVAEGLEDVVDRIRYHRAEILATADRVATADRSRPGPTLRIVNDGER